MLIAKSTDVIVTNSNSKMRSLKLLLILIVLTVSCSKAFSKGTLITGVVKGQLKGDSIRIKYALENVKFPIDQKTGKFNGTVELGEDQFINIDFFGTGDGMNIFAIDGETIDIEFEPETLKDYTFICKHKGQAVTSIYNQIEERLKVAGLDKTGYTWYNDLINEYKVYQPVAKKAMELVEGNKAQLNKISKHAYTDLFMYATYMNKLLALGDMTLEESKIAMQGLANVELTRSDVILDYKHTYVERLCFMNAALYLQSIGAEYNVIDNDIVNHIFVDNVLKYAEKPSMKKFILHNFLNRELLAKGIQHEDIIQTIFKGVGKGTFADLEKKYQDIKSKKYTTGEKVKVFDFEFVDMNGKKYTPKDFKGKVVYIDCWASWCAPCKAQMPFFHELEKKYQGKDVEFLSVSFDASQKAWKKAVDEMHLEGNVLWLEGNFKNKFAKYYNINAIPRFILIDKDGYIVSDDMPKPIKMVETSALIDANLGNSKLTNLLDMHIAKLNTKGLDDKNMLSIEYDVAFSFLKMKMNDCFYNGKVAKTRAYQENMQVMMLMGKDYQKPVVSKYNFESSQSKSSWIAEASGYELYYLNKFGYDMNLLSDPKEPDHFIIDAKKGGDSFKVFLNKQTLLIDKIDAKTVVELTSGGGYNEYTKTFHKYIQKDGYNVPVQIDYNGQKTELKSVVVKPVSSLFN